MDHFLLNINLNMDNDTATLGQLTFYDAQCTPSSCPLVVGTLHACSVHPRSFLHSELYSIAQ